MWIWTRDIQARGPHGKTVIKAEIECFAILQYHDALTNVENSTLELVDIHLQDQDEGLKFARALIDGLCDHYLRHTDKRVPYRLFFVNVDSVIPESSDDFLLDCGFVYDSSITMLSLAAPKAANAAPAGLSDAVPKPAPLQPHYSIVDTVKVASATEKPFTAYTVKDNFTGDSCLKRYREFDRLYARVKAALPKTNLPKPPKKKLFGNLDDDFVERRRKKLEQWLNALAEVPGVADSALIDDFTASQLQRRGMKQTEEDHLLEILKRANDKPVQIIDKPAEHILLQRVASHASSSSNHSPADSSDDSISSTHAKTTPSLLQATDSIFGSKRPSQPGGITTQTMPNLNAIATIGTGMTSPRSDKAEKSPRVKVTGAGSVDAGIAPARRSKPQKSFSEAAPSMSSPSGASSSSRRDSPARDGPADVEKKGSSSSSRSSKSSRNATLGPNAERKPRSDKPSSSHRSKDSASRHGASALRQSTGLRQSRESPI